MSEPATFREWLRTTKAPANLESFNQYLQGIGRESWESEFKAAVSDLGDYQPRSAVCGLANWHGGELLLGVTDAKVVVGTAFSSHQIEAFLHQPNAPRSEQHLSDLMHSIRAGFIEIELPHGSPNPRAVVIEVIEQALPAYVLNDAGELELHVRSGSNTRVLPGPEAIGWYRGRRRATILREIFREFDLMSRQVWPDKGWSTGISPVLPYFHRCLEDGSFYTYLLPGDRTALMGEANDSGWGGGMPGFLGRLLRLMADVEKTRSIIRSTGGVQGSVTNQYTVDNAVARSGDFVNLQQDLKRDRASFRTWIESQGIRVEPP